MTGWICPKCRRVYGPLVMACLPCGLPLVASTRTYYPWVPPIKRSKIEM